MSATFLIENAEAGGRGKRGHHGGGRGQNERAGAGDDEHGDDAVQVVRKGPDQRAMTIAGGV